MKKLLLILISVLSVSASAGDVVLSEKNYVYFGGTITRDTTLAVVLQLEEKLQKRADSGQSYPIYVLIDSKGGDIRAALSLGSAAQNIPNLHFVGIQAASAAFTLLQMSPGSRIVVNKPSLMVHPATSCYVYLNEDSFKAGMETSMRIHKMMIYANIHKTLISDAQYLEWIAEGDKYFTQEDIAAYHIADEVVKLKCDKTVKQCPVKEQK